MAAKSWETDFRYEAIKASLEKIDERNRSDVFNHDGSFVVPIAETPIVGMTPGKVYIAALILGFILMGTGLLLHGTVERDAKRGKPVNPILTPIAMSLSLFGFALCLVPMTMGRFILKQLLGHRGTELQRRHGQLTSAELSHADMTKMKLSIDGDDYVLLLADTHNRRLLVEGLAARYQIRSEDVTQLEPFLFMCYVGCKITFRIDERVTLTLAMAEASPLQETINQLPFLFFMKGFVKNRTLKICRSALQ